MIRNSKLTDNPVSFMLELTIMAKSKRSRRARRQTVEKPVQSTPAPAPVEKKPAPAAATPSRQAVDFAQEYYYVYAELRQILLMTAIMFATMIGLSYLI